MRSFAVLTLLLDELRDELRLADHSLLLVAAQRPLYPVLHCLRYLFSDVDLRLAVSLSLTMAKQF